MNFEDNRQDRNRSYDDRNMRVSREPSIFDRRGQDQDYYNERVNERRNSSTKPNGGSPNIFLYFLFAVLGGIIGGFIHKFITTPSAIFKRAEKPIAKKQVEPIVKIPASDEEAHRAYRNVTMPIMQESAYDVDDEPLLDDEPE